MGRENEKVEESIGEGDRGDWEGWMEGGDILYKRYKEDGDREGESWRVRDWSANGLFQKSYIRIV